MRMAISVFSLLLASVILLLQVKTLIRLRSVMATVQEIRDELAAVLVDVERVIQLIQDLRDNGTGAATQAELDTIKAELDAVRDRLAQAV